MNLLDDFLPPDLIAKREAKTKATLKKVSRPWKRIAFDWYLTGCEVHTVTSHCRFCWTSRVFPTTRPLFCYKRSVHLKMPFGSAPEGMEDLHKSYIPRPDVTLPSDLKVIRVEHHESTDCCDRCLPNRWIDTESLLRMVLPQSHIAPEVNSTTEGSVLIIEDDVAKIIPSDVYEEFLKDFEETLDETPMMLIENDLTVGDLL